MLSLGIGSLLRGVTVQRRVRRSIRPRPAATDALGAAPRARRRSNRELIGVLTDGLGIFSTTSGVFGGFSSYQPFATSGRPDVASAAGVSTTTPDDHRLPARARTVVDIGLPGFGSRLAHNVDAKELVRRWGLGRVLHAVHAVRSVPCAA